jgi:SAM-dependent methyltransferase
MLARAKYALRGYTQSSYSHEDLEKRAEYDFSVVDNWTKQLQEYTGNHTSEVLKNRKILELGPGYDLGVGLYLLARSAAEYNAVDAYNLVESTPEEFYSVFFSRLKTKMNIDTTDLSEELNRLISGNPNRLIYICREDFDVAGAMGARKVDTVFSQAAFEHFDNVEESIRVMSSVCDPGAIFVAVVDLQTHSRWIRQKDPNNIYRYPDWLYGLFRFRGAPNRVRPYQYKNALERYGWKNVTILSDQSLEETKHAATKDYLHKRFTDDKNQMHLLSAWICATKS